MFFIRPSFPPGSWSWTIAKVGLDIYVGSLTRYYLGDWELASQKAARELTIPLTVIRQYDQPDAIRDPSHILPLVLSWRDGLSQALRENLSQNLDWIEDPEGPYFTDKPTWDCYGDLMLWAAHEEKPQVARPQNHIKDWHEDVAYTICSANDFRSRYSHLYDVDMWFPCGFEFIFQAEDIGGRSVLIGSSKTLLKQLELLNSRTWKAELSLLDQWAFDGVEYGSPLEIGARFAFAVLMKLTRQSLKEHLRMRLDW